MNLNRGLFTSFCHPAGSAVATRAECWLALTTVVTTWPGLRLSCPAVLADIFSKALLQKIFILLSL